MTLENLWISSTTLEGGAWRRNYSGSPKRQVNQIVPFVGTKTVLFTGSFWGLTENSVHLANILFMDCDIVEEVVTKPIAPTPVAVEETPINNTQAVPQGTALHGTTHPTTIGGGYGGVVNAEPNYSTATHFKVTYNGVNYWIRKIDMKRQPVLIRCSCSDAYFVWSYANYTKGLQFGGKSKPYHRLTTTRKPKNPRLVPGACKHVCGFSELLKTSGYTL